MACRGTSTPVASTWEYWTAPTVPKAPEKLAGRAAVRGTWPLTGAEGAPVSETGQVLPACRNWILEPLVSPTASEGGTLKFTILARLTRMNAAVAGLTYSPGWTLIV